MTMTFLAPLAFVGAVLALPIILLYFMRWRRREVPVSSLYLWERVLRDSSANSWWQRLQRHLLLWLQLLALALLVLALARPATPSAAQLAQRTLILLDASTSMNAQDTPTGTRWTNALDQARALLEQVGVSEEISLVRVAERVEVLSDWTNEVPTLRTALDGAAPPQGSADWQSALTLAAGLSAQSPALETLILSDFSDAQALLSAMPEALNALRFVPVGTSSANVALSAFALRAGQTGISAFVQVRNYGTEAADVAINLRLDGALWQSRSATLAPFATQSFSLNIERPFSTASATLITAEAVNRLPDDDQAYAVAPASGARRVLLISQSAEADAPQGAELGNRFIEQALASLPNVEAFRADPSQSPPADDFDLVIYDASLPERLPDSHLWLINPPRSSALFSRASAPQRAQSLRVLREHPLLAFTEMSAVAVRQWTPLNPLGDWAQALIASGETPLLWAGEQAGRRIVLQAFSLSESDWALNLSFPLFVANLLEWATPDALIQPQSAAPNERIRFNVPASARSVVLTAPDGTQTRLSVGEGTLDSAQHSQLGHYQVQVLDAEESVLQSAYFAVNQFSAQESDIAPRPPALTPETANPASSGLSERVVLREWWQVPLILAVLVLVAEWYLYTQRYRRLS